MALAAKVGAEGADLFDQARQVQEAPVLAAIMARLKTATTLAEIRALLEHPRSDA